VGQNLYQHQRVPATQWLDAGTFQPVTASISSLADIPWLTSSLSHVLSEMCMI